MPEAAGSSGADAVEFAEGIGVALMPWQALALGDSMGERPDGRWAAREVGLIVQRQNGKGGVTEVRELYGAVIMGERLIMHSAHEFKTAQEAQRRLVGLVTNYDDLRRRVKRVINANGDEGIEFVNGSRIRFVARSKGSGRGFTADLVVLDEAFAVTDAHMAALLPTLSAVRNPQVWYTSTVPEADAPFLFGLRQRAEGDEPRLCYLEWSPPVGYEPTPRARPWTEDDRDVWYATNPSLGYLIDEEAVVAERSALDDTTFARERLGAWPPRAGERWAVVSAAEWAEAADRSAEPGPQVAFAVDIPPERHSASIAVASRTAAGAMLVELVEHRDGTRWVLDRLVELVERHRPVALVVDGAGPAGSLIAPLEALGVEVVKPTARDAAQAAGALYDAVAGDRRDLRHQDQAPLNLAVAGAQRRPLGDAWAWARGGSDVNIAPLVAVTLAAWGHETRAHLVTEPADPFAFAL